MNELVDPAMEGSQGQGTGVERLEVVARDEDGRPMEMRSVWHETLRAPSSAIRGDHVFYVGDNVYERMDRVSDST